LIDRTGKEIIKPKFVYMQGFSDDGFTVYESTKIGYYTHGGAYLAGFQEGVFTKDDKIIIKPKYEQVRRVNADMFEAMDDKGRSVFFDLNGKKVSKPAASSNLPSETSTGNAGMYRFEEKGKWGFKNVQDKIVIPAKYDLVSDFNDAKLAYVYQKGKSNLNPAKDVKQKPKLSVINVNGELLHPFEFPAFDFRRLDDNSDLVVITAWSTVDKLASHRSSNMKLFPDLPDWSVKNLKFKNYPIYRFGLYDLASEKMLIPLQPFPKQMIWVGELGYTDFDFHSLKHKKWIVATKSENKQFSPLAKNVVELEQLKGVIDYSGKVIIPCQYHFLDAYKFVSCERILVGEKNITASWRQYEEKTKYGILDYSGKVIIPMIECESIELIDNTFVVTIATGEKKYFDLNGREISK